MVVLLKWCIDDLVKGNDGSVHVWEMFVWFLCVCVVLKLLPLLSITPLKTYTKFPHIFYSF